MPQIVTIGTLGGEDYSSVAAWIASSDFSTDWGVGNPAIGQLTEKLNESVTFNTTPPPNGARLCAEAGKEYDGTNSSTAAGLVSNTFTLQLRMDDIEVDNIHVESTGSGAIAIRLGAFEGVNSNIHHCGVKAEKTNSNSHAISTYNGATFSGNVQNCLVEQAGGFGLWLRNECTGTIDQNTILDAAASGSSFRDGVQSDNANNVVTNTFALLDTGAHASSESFAGSYAAGADFNAGQDTSAVGSNSFDNRTSADLVNFAGGDFRTALSSPLATGGSGGTFIGAFVEEAGTVSVNDSTTNTNTSSNNDVVQLVGAFNVSDSVTNSNVSSNPDNILLVGEVSITDSVTNSNTSSNTDTASLVGEFIIQDSTTNTNTSSNNDSIAFVSIVSVSDSTTNTNTSSNNDTVKLVGEFIVEDSLTSTTTSSNADNVLLLGQIIINDSVTNTNTTSISDSILIGEFSFTVTPETNITAKRLSTNITAASLSTNISA